MILRFYGAIVIVVGVLLSLATIGSGFTMLVF